MIKFDEGDTAPILTIAIPTFNRKRELSDLIGQLRLFNLLDDRLFKILVIDNSSDYSVVDLVAGFASDSAIEVIENPVNYGLGANLMECFRRSGTKWLWIIGDDDKLFPDSAQLVISTLLGVSDQAICVNFSSDHGETIEAKSITDLDDLITHASFANILFISTNIYNVPKLMSHAALGYQSCFFHMPHTTMMLRAFLEDSNAEVVMSPDRIISANMDFSNLTWSRGDMMRIRGAYSAMFTDYGSAVVKKLRKFTMRGYGVVGLLKFNLKVFLKI